MYSAHVIFRFLLCISAPFSICMGVGALNETHQWFLLLLEWNSCCSECWWLPNIFQGKFLTQFLLESLQLLPSRDTGVLLLRSLLLVVSQPQAAAERQLFRQTNGCRACRACHFSQGMSGMSQPEERKYTGSDKDSKIICFYLNPSSECICEFELTVKKWSS